MCCFFEGMPFLIASVLKHMLRISLCLMPDEGAVAEISDSVSRYWEASELSWGIDVEAVENY